MTDILKEILNRQTGKQANRQTGKQANRQTNLIYAIGPVKMMQAVAEFTRSYNVKTIVSLNPIMVDATGMCGSCRCTVAGKTVFGCVDGPDFNAHEVDFAELEKRLKLFEDEERKLK